MTRFFEQYLLAYDLKAMDTHSLVFMLTCTKCRASVGPSEHAYKMFFNYSKLYVISLFCKESTLFTTKPRFLNEFSQHHWQESFDGDSIASRSIIDAYATLNMSPHPSRLVHCTLPFKKFVARKPFILNVLDNVHLILS